MLLYHTLDHMCTLLSTMHSPARARIGLVEVESDDVDGLKLHSMNAKVERISVHT